MSEYMRPIGLSIILSTFCIALSTSHRSITYDRLVDAIMHLWEEIDLVRAIHTTPQDKKLFMERQMTALEVICNDCLLFVSSVKDVLERDELISLLEDVTISFTEVFGILAGERLYIAIYDKLTHTLWHVKNDHILLSEAPCDLKEEPAFDHVCFEDVAPT